MKTRNKIKQILSKYIVLATLVCSTVYAQQSILLNQSSYNLFTVNPAMAGINNELQANCHYKKNWLGLSESPELVQVTVDGGLHKNKYGLGISIVNEKAGIFSKTYLAGSFRYKVKLAANHALLFGLSAGFQRQLSNFSKLKADAPDEFSQWPQQQAVTIPDAAFGLTYQFKKLLVFASANQLLQQNFSYKEPVFNKELQYKTVPYYVIGAQYTFELKKEVLNYTPNLIVRTPQGLPTQFDLNNTFTYKSKVLAGIGYRHSYAIYGSLGYSITEKLRVIYSYEYALGLQNITKGGHEIGLSFGLLNGSGKTKSTSDIDKNKLDEVFEKLDKHDQQVEVLNRRVDSLDKNMLRMKEEMAVLKSKQVSQDEIVKAIDSYFSSDAGKEKINTSGGSNSSTPNNTATKKPNKIDKGNKYKVINPKSDNDVDLTMDSLNANYKVVLGVYQLANYAKEYQKFLKREMNYDTKLVQLPDHPKQYIYVCNIGEYASLKEALVKLKEVRAQVKSKAGEITRGDAWILQTLND
jgi:type IX secretion system PorP/SprF family membrane protein